MNNIWSSPHYPPATIFKSIDDELGNYCLKYIKDTTGLKQAHTLFCFSDYSGEEADANYAVYSFVLIAAEQLPTWEKSRRKLRTELLADGRRISYKNYRDKLSQRYTDAFLDLANSLNGFLITVAIDKKIDTLFDAEGNNEIAKSLGYTYSTWSQDTKEKTFRVLHLLGFFIAGLSAPRQNLFWITDNDKISPNTKRLTELTNLFGGVASMYLKHNLGHLRVGTTNSDDGTRSIEDLCAIADLTAGAYSDQLKKLSFEDFAEGNFWFHSPNQQKKTNKLSWWLIKPEAQLQKIHIRMDRTGDSKIATNFFHFKNME